ncbi:uracil/xanthine transporter [Sporosarcina jiandibaonis]|uniref:uracil/xanthine transporter n=1 Tax=Sporosarcina jiandibaonis TaxID=2715535 RepID=UPI0015566351|nr:uracil/xanthine transporter [Sporosarcina jiandibaonis]
MNRLLSWSTTFASMQWLFFIFANIVVVPISIGFAFNLPPEQVATILRSALIVTGGACILQGLIGHRFPLMEGPSGVIWGLILNLCLSASSLGLSLQSIGGGIATGMILAGIATILLVAFNLISFIQKVFSPMVMSVYLLLLTFQLTFVFFNGMLNMNEDGTLNGHITLFSFCLAIIVALLKIKGNKIIGDFSILIGMIGGWIAYALLFPIAKPVTDSGVAAFSLFPLGPPNLEYSIIAITFLGCLINLSNTVASVQAASKLFNVNVSMNQYRFSYLLTGIYSIIASLFGLVLFAPFASSIGFLESTQIFDRRPFLIGGGLVILIGIIPPLGLMLATLPMAVGNAVLLVAYSQLLGTSLKSFNGYTFNSVTIYRIASPVLIGVSLMTVDASLFTFLPAIILPLITNGFIMGFLISLVMETCINWDDVGVDRKITN